MTIKITTPRKKGGPVERDFGDPNDLTQIRSCVTRSINAGTAEHIDHLAKELLEAKNKGKADFEANADAPALLERLQSAQGNIQQQPEIKITGARGSYDINKPDQFKKLKTRIKTYAKQQDLALLKSIKKQITEHLKTHKNDARLTKLNTVVKDLIKALGAKDHYQPYTQLLDAEFTLKPREKNKTPQTGETPASAIDKYKQDQTLTDYLEKPVSEKKKRGQDHVDALSACFWLDFLKNAEFFAEAGDRNNVIYYLVALRNFHSHNASYYPAQGYGLSSKEECEQPLYYIRSQTEHHETQRYKQETGIGKTCLGAQNSAYLKMVQRCASLSATYRTQLAAVGKNGQRGEALKDTTHYGNKITHLGSRANNVASSYLTMQKAFDQSTKDNAAELAKLIGNPDNVGTWDKANMANQLQLLQHEFAKLYQQSAVAYPQAASTLMQHRSQQARDITALLTDSLKKITVSTPTDSSVICIRLYPKGFKGKENEKNIKEGLTNVLLGFFGGLLNHYAKEAGLHYFVQRRQSFGFLRETLTDAGSLVIRLSLGGNPEPLKPIIVKAIEDFDKLLETFDFSKPTNSTKGHQTIINKTQAACETPQGEKETDKTGNYCLNAMRVEDDQWIALLAAEKYLSTNKTNQTAFKDYLQQFIIDRVDYKKIAESDHASIKREGYSLENKANIVPPSTEKGQPTQAIIAANPLLKLLNNLVETTINYTASLSNLPSSASLYYVLMKLLHHCQKGRAILKHAHEYELSHLQAKATLIIEGIQEHLILLRCLAKNTNGATENLQALEKLKFTQLLNVQDAENCHIFYNDSGQQAVNSAMMAMIFEGMDSFHMFAGNYYEIAEFCNDSGIQPTAINQSSTWVCDITATYLIREALKKPPAKLKALIIDITHNSSATKMAEISDIITTAREQGLWITLSCSTLKHEQLGQDKYQSGRNIILAPPGKSLNKQKTEKYLTGISNEAMNPLTAAYRQTVETVTHEASRAALERHGIFSNTTTHPAPAAAVPAPAQ
jgi:hypothetical protein